ncbi:MAG: hypothetical protein V7K67_31020 [Nostoc sp.]
MSNLSNRIQESGVRIQLGILYDWRIRSVSESDAQVFALRVAIERLDSDS